MPFHDSITNLFSTLYLNISPFVPNTPSRPPENIGKPYGFLMFSGGRERVYWERTG